MTTAIATVAIVILGAYAAWRMPVELLPDLSYPRLLVDVGDDRSSPAEIEQLVTAPVERALAPLPAVRHIESTARTGHSRTVLTFAWGTDMDYAALEVRERLENVRDELPQSASRPVIARIDPSALPVLAISLSGARDPVDLRAYADNVVRRRLELVAGVADVSVHGGATRTVDVDVAAHGLESLRLPLGALASQIAVQNGTMAAGTTTLDGRRAGVRIASALSSAADVAALPLAVPGRPQGGAGTRLRDVASVQEGRALDAIQPWDSGETAVMLLVRRESGASTFRLVAEARAAIDEMQRLEPGIRIRIASSQAGFLGAAMGALAQELMLGAIVVFLVLYAFTRGVRIAVAIVVTVPVAVIGTCALLHAAGVSLNVMSLGGLTLAVGLLLDNAIVVAESIQRHRDEGASLLDAIGRGTMEVQSAVVAGTATTIAVFLPIAYLDGVAGRLFRPLAFAVCVALAVSVVLALTLLPMLIGGSSASGTETGRIATVASQSDASDARSFSTRASDVAMAAYHRAVDCGLRYPTTFLCGALVMVAAGALVAARLERGLLPRVDEGRLRVTIELPPGTPAAAVSRIATTVDSTVRSTDGIESTVRWEGTLGTPDEGVAATPGSQYATLDAYVRDGIATAPIVRRLAEVLPRPAGASIGVRAQGSTSLSWLLGTRAADIEVETAGDDLADIEGHAEVLRRSFARDPLLANVASLTAPRQPELRAAVDERSAASFGLATMDVARTLGDAARGFTATYLIDGEQRTPVRVRLSRDSTAGVEALLAQTVRGVPFASLTRLDTIAAPSEIRRAGQTRVATVAVDAAGVTVDEAIARMRPTLARNPAPPGAIRRIGGAFEERRIALSSALMSMLLAGILVYLILVAEFQSLTQPLVVLLCVPLGLCGSIFALYAANQQLNTVSMIGMIVLLGIVDNDAVLKVDCINRLRRAGWPLREAIHEAGRLRIRPIVVNSLTAIIGVLPMAWGIGAGAELQAPMAIAIAGGLLSGTVLTLVIVPVAYCAHERAYEATRVWIRRASSRSGTIADPVSKRALAGHGAESRMPAAAERSA